MLNLITNDTQFAYKAKRSTDGIFPHALIILGLPQKED